MSKLDDAIEALFANSIDGNSRRKDKLFDSVLTEKSTPVQEAKAQAVLNISQKMSEVPASADPSVMHALKACLSALVKA